MPRLQPGAPVFAFWDLLHPSPSGDSTLGLLLNVSEAQAARRRLLQPELPACDRARSDVRAAGLTRAVSREVVLLLRL